MFQARNHKEATEFMNCAGFPQLWLPVLIPDLADFHSIPNWAYFQSLTDWAGFQSLYNTWSGRFFTLFRLGRFSALYDCAGLFLIGQVYVPNYLGRLSVSILIGHVFSPYTWLGQFFVSKRIYDGQVFSPIPDWAGLCFQSLLSWLGFPVLNWFWQVFCLLNLYGQVYIPYWAGLPSLAGFQCLYLIRQGFCLLLIAYVFFSWDFPPTSKTDDISSSSPLHRYHHGLRITDQSTLDDSLVSFNTRNI